MNLTQDLRVYEEVEDGLLRVYNVGLMQFYI